MRVSIQQMSGVLAAAAPAVGAAVAALLGLTLYGTVSPRSQLWGPVVSRSKRASSEVALTFDDGPTPQYTDGVLDALRDMGAHATFFVIGQNAERWPDLVRRMHDEGHAVANHTFDHSHYASMGRGRYWREQIERTDEAIEQVIGRRPVFFRPPMGVKTWHTARAARQTGHTVVTWNRRAWDALPTSVESIVSRLVPRSRPGDILMLHDGLEPNALKRDPATTAAAVRPLIEGLRRRGLTPQRLDRLLGVEPYFAGTSGPVQAPAFP